MIEGIDVSVWQGRINWSAVSGVGFAIAKASEGVGFTDPQWLNNQAALLEPGPIIGGSYHFGRPDYNDPIVEADWYLSRHDNRCFSAGTPWIFSLDAESAGGSAGWCYAFMDRVATRIGYSPWFYSYTSWIGTRGVRAFERPLWIAAPSSPRGAPPNMGWPAVSAHQWGVRGVSGIGGEVDANDFEGDLAALLKLAGAGLRPVIKGGDSVPRVVQGSKAGDPVFVIEGGVKFPLSHPVQLGFELERASQDKVWRPGEHNVTDFGIDRYPAVPAVPMDLSATVLKSYNDSPWPIPKAETVVLGLGEPEEEKPAVAYDDPRWGLTLEELQAQHDELEQDAQKSRG